MKSYLLTVVLAVAVAASVAATHIFPDVPANYLHEADIDWGERA